MRCLARVAAELLGSTVRDRRCPLEPSRLDQAWISGEIQNRATAAAALDGATGWYEILYRHSRRARQAGGSGWRNVASEATCEVGVDGQAAGRCGMQHWADRDSCAGRDCAVGLAGAAGTL
jgi:hypothetical protein